MMTPLVMPDQPDRPAATGSRAIRALEHPAGLGLISALLLWMSFPPAEWSWVAWLALVPLFSMVMSGRSRWAIYGGAWLGGWAFWLLAVQWVLWTDPTAWVGWLAMAGFLSLWWPGFLFLARFARLRLDLPLMLSAPIAWVALEFARAFILTGFPWYYLAHSQYRQIYVTQIADFSGSLGISFLIATVNAYFVDLLTLQLFRPGAGGSWWGRMTRAQRVRLMATAFGVVGTLGYGTFRVGSARFRPGPRIALLQSGEVMEYDSPRRKSAGELKVLYEGLVEKAARRGPRPDLIVWPETSFPYGFVSIEPKLDAGLLDKLAKLIDPEMIGADWISRRDMIAAYFQEVMGRLQIPMMVGSTTHDFGRGGYSRYNSAILMRAGSAAVQSYHKLHLVPFGEYIPLIDIFPWMARLGPYRGTRPHNLDRGTGPSWFDLGPYRLAAAICFEDTVPHVVRRAFSDAPDGRQPDVLVNLSNDGWFHRTSEHEMHLAVSTFRCVENRVPLARAVNTGISAVVDGNGRIVRSLGKTVVDVLEDVIPLDDRESLYTRWGDWLGTSCAASTLGLVVLGAVRPRRKLGSDLGPV